jgi:hypothetical protein
MRTSSNRLVIPTAPRSTSNLSPSSCAGPEFRARRAAIAMADERLPARRRITLAADKGYETRGFSAACRELEITPHVAQNEARPGGSAIDGRTAHHPGYAVSQRIRKKVEEAFGWMKTIEGLRKSRTATAVGNEFRCMPIGLPLGNFTRENRETPAKPVAEGATGRLEKALRPKSNMHGAGESDGRTQYLRSARTTVSKYLRRAWREGDRPKRTSGKRPRPGPRAGPAS